MEIPGPSEHVHVVCNTNAIGADLRKMKIRQLGALAVFCFICNHLLESSLVVLVRTYERWTLQFKLTRGA
jgi:hypothetical protein